MIDNIQHGISITPQSKAYNLEPVCTGIYVHGLTVAFYDVELAFPERKIYPVRISAFAQFEIAFGQIDSVNADLIVDSGRVRIYELAIV